MPIFITTGNYSSEAMKGMMAQPEDRTPAIKSLVEAAGGKLIALYMTSGSNDFMVIAEADDIDMAATAVMVTAATGTASNFNTIRAWTPAEFAECAKKAGVITGAYSPPGS